MLLYVYARSAVVGLSYPGELRCYSLLASLCCVVLRTARIFVTHPVPTLVLGRR